MSDQNNRASILNAKVTEFGVAYVAVDGSALGGYFTVVFASP